MRIKEKKDKNFTFQRKKIHDLLKNELKGNINF